MDDSNAPMPRAVADLIEKQAILELVQDYSRAVDRRDFALLASLYTEDGIDDHAGLYCGPVGGFVDWLRAALEGVDATTHHVHNVTIALEGTHAEGEVYLTAYNRLRGADGGLCDFVQGLRYLDRYRRDPDRWRFERRTVACDWAQQGPSIWDPSHPLIAGKRLGRADGDDASYSMLRSPVFARR